MLIRKNNLKFSACVILIKTDENFSKQASFDLESRGYKTVCCTDFDEGLRQISQLNPVMVIVDYTNIKKKEINFCRKIRKKFLKVILLLVFNSATLDARIISLETGADDFLEKPYKSKQFLSLLSLYVKCLNPVNNDNQLNFGELKLDLTNHQLKIKGETINLTLKEFQLLKFFMINPDEILSKEKILENVWGYDFEGESNIIEVYIRYLRRKLEKEGQKQLLQTVRGLGYILRKS